MLRIPGYFLRLNGQSSVPATFAVIAVLLTTPVARAGNGTVKTVFVIDMENHNLSQPSSVTVPSPVLGNTAAPYLNSLITPGAANAAQTAWASNYDNVAIGVHPSESNYIWQEAGSNLGVADDDDPYVNGGQNVQTSTSLTGLLRTNGVSWKSYQEDIDLVQAGGSVNQPGENGLSSTIASTNQWTVPTSSFSGTSATYTNVYNGSHQYGFAAKHDGSLFFTDSNGGTKTTANFSNTNPLTSFYAPLQQLSTDLTNNTVSRYNLITPDLYNDMHTPLSIDFTYHGTIYAAGTDQEAVAVGDNFLSVLVPQIEASQAYKDNGAIFIWYDETEGGDSTAFTIPSIVISPLAKGNAFNSIVTYTHSSDVKTLQSVFGIAGSNGSALLGDAASPGTNDLSALFVTGAIPNISGTAAPEPISAALLLLGVFGTGGVAFRRANINRTVGNDAARGRKEQA